jgi:PAS domain S-box-containing protein
MTATAPQDVHASTTWRWPFVVAMVLLIVLGVLAVRQYTRFTRATDAVDHAYQVMQSIDDVVAGLLEAEAALRGYLLTSDRSFLAPYDGIGPGVRAALADLDALVDGDPGRREAARRLTSLVDGKLSEMADMLRLFDEGDETGAKARLAEGQGKRLMDLARAVGDEMRAAEQSLLTQRAAQARLARRAALGFAIATTLVALMLGLLAFSINRAFEGRRLALAAETIARLEAEREADASAAGWQQSESFNRSILDHSGDCITVLKRDGTIVLMNRPGMALLQLAAEGAWQREPWSTLWGHHANLADEAVAAAAATGEGRFTANRILPTGTTQWWDVIVTPVRDEHGEVVRLVAIGRDVSEQKRAEEERAALLASERAARSEAERAARLKDDFVSTLSHELRTPLNAILGWVGVLKLDQRPETLAKAIDVIDRNSRRQSQMIDDLLDVGRIVSGKLRLDVQQVNLASVVEEAVTSARPAADAKGVRLVQVLGSAGTIQGDPGRLQQVIWNLLSNAIKFTPRGGLVQVTLRKVDSHADVEVRDTGVGIRPDLLPHVFQRFRQGDPSFTKRQGGLGLGLAIVKNLVEMHGGSVEAASDGEGAGSVFTVRLPLASTHAKAEARGETLDLVPAQFAELLAGVQVLVLDDEADAREIVQRLLEDSGATVVTTGTAEDALSQLSQGLVPDVIVSDIGMPDQDGYEFMQRVRRLGGPVSSVPAAALTALARLEDRKRALMAGYQSHLAKPVDPTELVAMVASMTGRTGRG